MMTYHDEDIVFTHAYRTPIGRMNGKLKRYSAVDLAQRVVERMFSDGKIPRRAVDEIVLGNLLSAGLGQGPARQVALRSGLDERVCAYTINMLCGSGLKSVIIGSNAIRSGESSVVIAGGMDSMSQTPALVFPEKRYKQQPVILKKYPQDPHSTVINGALHDAFWCAFSDQHIINAADKAARDHRLSKQEIDTYCFTSHQKTLAAIQHGGFDDEIVAVDSVTQDEIPLRKQQRKTTLDTLLRAHATQFNPQGVTTRENSPGLCDAAAAVMLMSYSTAQQHGLEPLARVAGHATHGTKPDEFITAPLNATRKLLDRTGYAIDDFDVVEINESFGLQGIIMPRELGIHPDRVNVKGGAVALGHPLGAAGTRILVTLLHTLRERDARMGLAMICLGGGNAVSMAVERDDGGNP